MEPGLNSHKKTLMVSNITESLQIVRENLRAFFYLNLFFYGLLLLTVIYAAQNPDMQRSMFYAAQSSVQKGLLAPIYEIYHVERNIPLAAVVTFVVNLVAGSALMLTLPSFVVPFIGLPILMYRFVLWGLIFGPDRILQFASAGTLFLEGQGYIIAALAIYLHGTRFLRPTHHGYHSYAEGYRAGLKLTARLYVLVTLVLLVAALYESIVGISTIKPLFPKTGTSYAKLVADKQHINFSGSSMFYDSTGIDSGDAKTAGLVLEEIGYFRLGDSTSARISRQGSFFTIEVCVPAAYWEHEKIQGRFAYVFTRLEKVFPNRQYQLTAYSIDDSGRVAKKTFHSQSAKKPSE